MILYTPVHSGPDIVPASKARTEKYLSFHGLSYTISEVYNDATDTMTITINFFNGKPAPSYLVVLGRIWLRSSSNEAKEHISYSKKNNRLTIHVTNYKIQQTIYNVLSDMADVQMFSRVSDGFKIICSPKSRHVNLNSKELEKLNAITIPGVSSVSKVWQVIIQGKSKLIIRMANNAHAQNT